MGMFDPCYATQNITHQITMQCELINVKFYTTQNISDHNKESAKVALHKMFGSINFLKYTFTNLHWSVKLT